MSPRARYGVLVAALQGLAGCRSEASHSLNEGSKSAGSSRPSAPPPLDTSWERDPGRLLMPGERAPDFEGIAHTGMRVRLSSFNALPLVVYFYGADKTPEATAEARSFRDAWLKLSVVSAMVLGVSTDDRIQHRDFATSEDLPFLLVSDETRKIARAFGVPNDGGRNKSVTFIVGTDGNVARVFQDGPPETQASAVLAALDSPH